MDTLTFPTPTHLTPIADAVNATADAAYEAARANGWHKDFPQREDSPTSDAYDTAVRAWVVSKLFLTISEVVEAGEELRDGGSRTRNYYTDADGLRWEDQEHDPDTGAPLLKPEGFPSEMADVIIRVGDLVGVLGIDLGAAVVEKLAYNATRGQRHGGKKF